MYDQERKAIAQDLKRQSPGGSLVPVDAGRLDRLIDRYEQRLAQQADLLEKQKQRIIILEADNDRLRNHPNGLPGVTGG